MCSQIRSQSSKNTHWGQDPFFGCQRAGLWVSSAQAYRSQEEGRGWAICGQFSSQFIDAVIKDTFMIRVLKWGKSLKVPLKNLSWNQRNRTNIFMLPSKKKKKKSSFILRTMWSNFKNLTKSMTLIYRFKGAFWL